MEIKELKNAVMEIENTATEEKGNMVIVTNAMEGFRAVINPGEVLGYQYIVSPFNEDCLLLGFSDEDVVIVTPNDFVVNVPEQTGYIRVEDVPPMISISEVLTVLGDYEINPEPAENTDDNVGLYFMYRHLIHSLQIKGFETNNLMKRLNAATEGKDIAAKVAQFEAEASTLQ